MTRDATSDAPNAPRLPRPVLRIGDAERPARPGETRAVLDPATGRTLLEVPEADATDVGDAVAAARRAFDEGPWPRTSVQDRARLLERVADGIEAQNEELAWLETLDTGKTLIESRADMDQIAQVFRYYAAQIRTDRGDVNPVPGGALSLTVHDPVGVAAMITPWNYPLLQASWKIAPALAAGCTFVIKPSELTPLTTLRFAEMLLEADLPAGVANVVTGAGATVGAALVEDPRVDLISFTGGIATGRTIATAAARNVARVALELGGKNPNIVLEDADAALATDHALNAVFFHAGQVCSAGSRLLVHERLEGELVARVLDRVRDIRVGLGWDPATEMGPLISAEHRDKVEGYVRLAQEEGAELRAGGGRPAALPLAHGAFLEPTVLTGLPHDGRVAQEEIFGPVLTVTPFADEDEAIELANATDYGLVAGVYTENVGRAHRFAREVDAGQIYINEYFAGGNETPFGGFKDSGIGRENGVQAIDNYTQVKNVCANIGRR